MRTSPPSPIFRTKPSPRLASTSADAVVVVTFAPPGYILRSENGTATSAKRRLQRAGTTTRIAVHAV